MDRYEQRGVSSGKEGVHKAVAGLNKGLFPGAFCTILPHDAKSHFVPHADGAGTKSVLYYLAHKYGLITAAEWGAGVAQDGIVMNTDDVACVGGLGGYLTQNIDRNRFIVSDGVVAEIIAGAKAFCEQMEERFHIYHIYIDYAAGETADVGDAARTILVNNSLFTILPAYDVIDASRIEVGDVIVGFSSTGQAVWEDAPNSGMGCNGLTNARHDVLHADYRADTETYAPEIPPEEVYSGSYHLGDTLPGDDRFTIASALLSPTRTYLPLIKMLMHEVGVRNLHALIHCTGGGQTKIRKFGPPEALYVKDDLFPDTPLFTFLHEARRLPWQEMFKSYSGGHRLEAVVPAAYVDKCIQAAQEYGIEAKRIGAVHPRTSATRLIIKSPHGEFLYE